MIPILRPKLPEAASISHYLSTVDSNRQYSNFGDLHNTLCKNIAENYSSRPENLVLFSSCTTALLSLLLDYSHLHGKKHADVNVLIPGWSFVATLQAPLSLGMSIHFSDVDRAGVLGMDGAVSICEAKDIDVVILVAPFGRAIDYSAWEAFALRYDKTVIVDAAAGFCSIGCTSLPTAVSMHATKIFSTGEGGFVLSEDVELVERLRGITNFGLQGSHTPSFVGLNFKLSEFACAVGLASLERHKATIRQYENQLEVYARVLKKSPALDFFGDLTPRTTMNVKISSKVRSVDSIIFSLAEQHSIQARRWWGKPLYHLYQGMGFSSGGLTSLSNSEKLAERVIGLPLGPELSPLLLEKIAEVVIKTTESHMV